MVIHVQKRNLAKPALKDHEDGIQKFNDLGEGKNPNQLRHLGASGALREGHAEQGVVASACQQDTFSSHVGGERDHEGVVQTHERLELYREADGAEERGACDDEGEVRQRDEGGVVRSHEREGSGERMQRS